MAGDTAPAEWAPDVSTSGGKLAAHYFEANRARGGSVRRTVLESPFVYAAEPESGANSFNRSLGPACFDRDIFGLNHEGFVEPTHAH